MLKIKNLTIKNFMSVGNVTQAIEFNNDLTLVLGENLDLGANGSRNGTGKTTIVNALSYALYGNALTKIKLGNLINKTNEKGMLVSVEFSKNNTDYKIERGRKTNVLRLFVGGVEMEDNDALGDSRETQKAIEDILGLSHDMFKHIVALNTHTEPFLNMKVSDQRDIIEELLGITLLSEKASILKEVIKDSKDHIKQENFKITALKESNKRIELQLTSLDQKSKVWDQLQLTEVNSINTAIEELSKININTEVSKHKDLEKYLTDSKAINDISQALSTYNNSIIAKDNLIKQITAEIELLNQHKCYTCGQKVHDSKQQEIVTAKNEIVKEALFEKSVLEESVASNTHALTEITLGEKPVTFYKTLEEALNHKHTLYTLNSQLETRANEDNPYNEQIVSIRTETLQEIDYNTINKTTVTLDHQQFLLKLLTDKDSFVRKQIISQNLSFLNNKLTYYINAIGLRHLIEFKDDLSVEITDLGKDFDFDNLSRGEKNRVILSLSWAFRDVWENLYSPINLLFVDEVIDSGMDDAGVEHSLAILKTMTREQNKSVWLISHKNELVSRVNNVIYVVKENGFTSFGEITQ
jgi:DNA repair exonuclease SbcCD ATPase subunit